MDKTIYINECEIRWNDVKNTILYEKMPIYNFIKNSLRNVQIVYYSNIL